MKKQQQISIVRTKGEIRRIAIQLLTLKGHTVWINNNVAIPGRKFIGRKGVPDIIGFNNAGKWVVAEVKTVTDKLSMDQIEFLTEIKKCGGVAYLAVQDKLGNIVLEDFVND